MQQEIKVDMDWRPPKGYIDHYENLVCTVMEQWGIEYDFVNWFSSLHGWHVRVHLMEAIEDDVCLLLQFLLGDDRTRCRLNYARFEAGILDWNKLFKGKILSLIHI